LQLVARAASAAKQTVCFMRIPILRSSRSETAQRLESG
jgi:hypothetical protein